MLLGEWPKVVRAKLVSIKYPAHGRGILSMRRLLRAILQPALRTLQIRSRRRQTRRRSDRLPHPPSQPHAARQALGRRSEQLARRVLMRQGYTIHATNVRFPVGEIDIVARDGQTLCFIEVRSASSEVWGGPLATIDAGKRRRLIRAAQWYLSRHPAVLPEIRFDVLAIQWQGAGEPDVELIRGALDAS